MKFRIYEGKTGLFPALSGNVNTVSIFIFIYKESLHLRTYTGNIPTRYILQSTGYLATKNIHPVQVYEYLYYTSTLLVYEPVAAVSYQVLVRYVRIVNGFGVVFVPSTFGIPMSFLGAFSPFDVPPSIYTYTRVR